MWCNTEKWEKRREAEEQRGGSRGREDVGTPGECWQTECLTFDVCVELLDGERHVCSQGKLGSQWRSKSPSFLQLCAPTAECTIQSLALFPRHATVPICNSLFTRSFLNSLINTYICNLLLLIDFLETAYFYHAYYESKLSQETLHWLQVVWFLQ